MIILDLPMPPSANHIWRSGRGRVYRSPEYMAWRTEAGWLAKSCKPIAGPVCIEIAVSPKGRGDVDNRIKPTIDALVSSGLIEGDDKKTVRAIHAYWSDDMDLRGVRVAVASASEKQPQGQGNGQHVMD